MPIGIYHLNRKNNDFIQNLNNEIYLDKSMLIQETNKIEKDNAFGKKL